MSALIPSIESGAVYRALPTGPHDDDHDSEIAVDDSGTDNFATDQPVDSRIRWVYFMLGCAVLLPWNGEFMTPFCNVILYHGMFSQC
jgi:equilibrative nucleoside transporter 1/2/3